MQDMTTQAVLLILNSTRAADIPSAIKGLDHEQQAYLMAYLYKVRGDWPDRPLRPPHYR